MKRNAFLWFALVYAFLAVPIFAASYVVPPDDVFIRKSDSIVLARAISSSVEEREDGVTVTVNRFGVEMTLKGFAMPVIDIETPGGLIHDRGRLVTGSPAFTPGVEYLLFLQIRPDGGTRFTDFGLGVFTFDRTPRGRRTLQRGTGVFGWDLDGAAHREVQRDADAFLEFIRAVSRGETAPVVPAYEIRETVRHAIPMVTAISFTGTSYTSVQGFGGGCVPAGCGSRWDSFTVNWNQGNTQTGAPGTPAGKTAITTAFASWNSSGVINYAYHDATAGSNTKGALDAPDGVNNIVFEKNLSQSGGPFSCATGGLLGVGGPHARSGTHPHNGEVYFTTTEADVSMNQGVANCASLFNTGDFNTAVTHEVGHTLGFRHSDQTRANDPDVACSTDASLECSNSAVMRGIIPFNINGALQGWDTNAVQTVYGNGPVCTAPSITGQPGSTAIAPGSPTTLAVIATGTSLAYQWYVGNPPDATTSVGGAGMSSSLTVAPSSTKTYWVKVSNSCGFENSSAATVTVNIGCTAPGITQPGGQSIGLGSSTTITVTATSSGALHYQWYRGVAGDTSHPIGTDSASVVTGSLTTTSSFWVKVSNDCSTNATSSSSITIAVVQPRKRAARH